MGLFSTARIQNSGSVMRRIVFSIGLLVLIFQALPLDAAQERAKLIIGYSAMQASVAPLWIAQE